MIYLLPILLYAVSIYAKSGKKLLQWLGSLVLILIVGLRFRIGGDSYNYELWYSWIDINGANPFLLATKFAPLWTVFFVGSKIVGLSWLGFQFLHAVVLVLLLRYAAKLWKADFGVLMFLFLIALGGRYFFEVMREAIAAVLVAIGYIKKTERKGFLWPLSCAFLFHYSAILMLPIFFTFSVSKFKLKNIVLIGLSLITCISLVLGFWGLDQLNYFLVYLNYKPTWQGIIGTLIISLFPILILELLSDRNKEVIRLSIIYFLASTILFIAFRAFNFLLLLALLGYSSRSNPTNILNLEGLRKTLAVSILLVALKIVPLYQPYSEDLSIPWIRQWLPYSGIFDQEINKERERIFKEM